MRATVAIVAAFASLAVAAPGYYGEKPAEETPCSTDVPAPTSVPAYPVETPEVSKSVPAYPVETPEVSKSVPSYPVETPEYPTEPEYPVETPEVSKSVPSYPEETPSKPEEPEYPTKPTETPEYPTEPEETCLSSTTVTVTIPHGTGYPVGPKPTESPYYPIVPSGTGYPPAPPAGTGYPPAPPAGTGYPTSTGGYTKPSAPSTPEFTGAASSLNVAGFVAGVGAFAALFL